MRNNSELDVLLGRALRDNPDEDECRRAVDQILIQNTSSFSDPEFIFLAHISRRLIVEVTPRGTPVNSTLTRIDVVVDMPFQSFPARSL